MAIRHITYQTPFPSSAAPSALMDLCTAGHLWVPVPMDVVAGDWLVVDVRAGDGSRLVTFLGKASDVRLDGSWRARVELDDAPMLGRAAYALSQCSRHDVSSVRAYAA
ncbi:MAG: hypothetical protein AAGE52_13170 [Myxococcota bacterium]